MNNNQNIQKNKESKYTVITMSVLIFILLIAFLGIAKNNINLNISNSSSNLILKPVNTTVSGKDGKNHSVSAEFAISGKKKDIDRLNKDAINLIILEEIKNLDFEEITGPNGNEKLKESILKALKANYNSINKVYIKNFTTDIQINKNPENNKNNRKDYLKGFKWNKHD